MRQSQLQQTTIFFIFIFIFFFFSEKTSLDISCELSATNFAWHFKGRVGGGLNYCDRDKMFRLQWIALK